MRLAVAGNTCERKVLVVNSDNKVKEDFGDFDYGIHIFHYLSKMDLVAIVKQFNNLP